MPQTETESLHTVCNLRRVSSFGFFLYCALKKKEVHINRAEDERKIESDARAMKMKRQLNKKIKLTHRKESRRRDTDKS